MKPYDPLKIQVIIVPLLCLLASLVVAQSVPPVFEHSTVRKAKRASKQSGKPVFVFVYSDWSMPAVRMLDSTFVDKKVVNEISSDYEAVAINAMRKKKFAEEYQVYIFPTLFVTDMNGTVIIRSKGEKDPTELLQTLAKTRSNSRFLKQSLDSIVLTVDQNNILESLDSIRYYKDDFAAKNLAKRYLDRKGTNWSEPVNMLLIRDYFTMDKDYLKFISKYHFKFFEVFDSLQIKENIAFHIFINSIKTNGRGRPEFNYKPVKKWFRRHRILGAEKLENFVKIKYRLWGRGPSVRYSVNLLKDYPETTDENVLYASVIRLMISESRRSIDYNDLIYSLKRSIKEDGTFLRYDLLSLLYYKVGKNKLSNQAIETAQNIAEVLEEDYEPTLPFIKDLITSLD